MLDIGDAQKHDRQIPGNPLWPQTGLRAAAPHDRIRGWAQGRRRVDHVSSKPLKQPRLARRHAEMVELHLSLRPRQHRSARKRGGVAMLVDAVEQRGAAGGGDGPKGHANGRAWRNADAAADRKDGVEDGAGRIRQRTAVRHGDGRANAAAATEESRSVGLEFGRAYRFAVDDAQMRGPDFRVGRRPSSPGRHDRADVGPILSFNEQFREGWMRDVGALRRENDLGVRRDFDLAGADAGIRDRNAANFGVVLAGYKYVQRRRQRAVAARHLDAVLVEGHGIGVRLDAARLEARRPRHAAAHVLDEEDRSRSRRRSHLRASASAPNRPSGCNPSPPTSAWWRSDRWREDAWRASPDPRRGIAVRRKARRRARWRPTSLPPPTGAWRRRRAACAPAATVRWP